MNLIRQIFYILLDDQIFMLSVKGELKDSTGSPLSEVEIKVFDIVHGNPRLLVQPQLPDQNGILIFN